MADWHTPIIRVQGSNLDFWNNYLVDNMAHLKAPPTDHDSPSSTDWASGAATNSSSWANIVGGVGGNYPLSLSVTTYGGDLWICWQDFGSVSAGAGYVDILFNGARLGGTDGLVQTSFISGCQLTIYYLVQNLAAGTHTIIPQFKATGGTFSLIGTSNVPQFWAKEMS